MFAAPPRLETTIYASLPSSLYLDTRESAWAKARGGDRLHSFLEGPSFSRDGHLYCVDIPHGRIFRITSKGEFETVLQYEGEPNGLKIHRDGRIFIADRQHGILILDPSTKKLEPLVSSFEGEQLHGVNDLLFSSNGDLYFTDQGESALDNPTGRVFRRRVDGTMDLLMGNLAGPNGLAFDPAEKALYVAITRDNAVYRLPLRENYGGLNKPSRFVQLLGGAVGPDGLATDTAGNLAVVAAGSGTVWVFDRFGEPIHRIASCAGVRTTNLAYGGADMRTLYITEAEAGVILQVKLPVPGRAMYSHL